MNADETDAPETLLSLRAAAALGLRPATVKQDILRSLRAAGRLPHGAITRLFVTPTERERYRQESFGAQGWDKRGETATATATRETTDMSCSR
jgi:hypothetical protein